DDFYRGAHRKVFRAMVDLTERSAPVDLITLSETLKARGQLAEVGGAAYLAELTERVPTAANAAHYAKIVRERSILRGLIEASTEIATRGYQAPANVDELLDHAERLIFSIQERKVKQAFAKLSEVLVDSIKMIERLYEQKQAVTGVSTGFADLDALTAGLQPSDLIIVAGRPSMGKTAFVLCIAEHAALRTDTGVAIFSLEMAKEQLAMRMLCSAARGPSRMRDGRHAGDARRRSPRPDRPPGGHRPPRVRDVSGRARRRSAKRSGVADRQEARIPGHARDRSCVDGDGSAPPALGSGMVSRRRATGRGSDRRGPLRARAAGPRRLARWPRRSPRSSDRSRGRWELSQAPAAALHDELGGEQRRGRGR